MPTLFTDPRSGGIKKSSGVNVLPIVNETWAEVRDDSNDIDWLMAGYHGTSKTDITILTKGHGGLEACANVLPCGIPVFGGIRLQNGKFVTFFYADEGTTVIKKGRASMHKNGVLNVLEGSVYEIDIQPGMIEEGVGNSSPSSFSANRNISSSPFDNKQTEKTHDLDENPASSNDDQHQSPPKNNDNSSDGYNDGTSGTTTMKNNFYKQQSYKATQSRDPASENGDQHQIPPKNNDSGGSSTSSTTRMKNNFYTQQSYKAKQSRDPVQLNRKMKSIDINSLSNCGGGSNNSLDMINKPTEKASFVESQSNKTQGIATESLSNSESSSSLKNSHQTNSDTTTIPMMASNYIPYSELKGLSDVSMLPPGVDPLNRELSLSDEEFFEVFGMEKDVFSKLPSWKRINQKKKNLLF